MITVLLFTAVRAVSSVLAMGTLEQGLLPTDTQTRTNCLCIMREGGTKSLLYAMSKKQLNTIAIRYNNSYEDTIR